MPLTLNPTGTTGLHALRTEGVDLGTATDSFALVLDLEPGSSASNTNDLLEGPGGADLTQLLSLGANGVSSSDARGASGALILSVSVPKANLTVSPTVKACIGWSAAATCAGTLSGATPTNVTAGGAVKVEAAATVDTNVYADARAGGIIQVGVARGKGTVAGVVNAEIGDRGNVTAGGDLSLAATYTANLNVEVIVAGGGVIAVADTDASGVMTHATLAPLRRRLRREGRRQTSPGRRSRR